MKNWKVRPAVLAELDFLVQGNMEMARETESLQLDADALRAGIKKVLSGIVPGRYYILEERDRVIGQLLITFEWSDWRNRDVWWIQSVYVLPKERGKGHFKKLYHSVLEEAKHAKAAGLRLYVENENRRAQAVYTALGMNGDRYRVFEKMFDEPPEIT